MARSGSTITTMIKQNVTIKVRKGTLKKLRILHAMLDESMVVILDRLVTDALKDAQSQDLYN